MQTILNEKEQDVIRTTYLWNAPGKDYQKLPASELAALAQRCATTPDNIRKIRERAMKKLKSALEPVMARVTARTRSDE
jgi:DNA-directed RNA polymerase sigma subunit (sigma70/sigma32)